MANRKAEISVVKVGRLKMTVARQAHVKSADIYITENQIRHIAAKHGAELKQLGISALDYVKIIVSNFNQIRQGTDSSILLVIYKPNKSHAAAIDLNYSVKKEFWEVKTAQPRTTKYLKEKRLRWQNCYNSE